MAIIPLPNYSQMRRMVFSVRDGTRSAAIGDGSIVNVSQIYEPLYEVRIETVPLTREQRAPWSVFRRKLQGGINLFSAYDVSKHPLLAYAEVENVTDIDPGWDGTAEVDDLGGDTIEISGLPAGLQIKAGDMIGLTESGKYDLYEVIADVTAEGSPGGADVQVAPFVRDSVFTAAAKAVLWKPLATFVLDWQSWQEDATIDMTPISFRGVQRI